VSVLYDDLPTFFAERGIRRRANGSYWEDSFDYGCWWLDGERRAYRLTWIGAQGRYDPALAGELYLVRLSGPHVAALGEGVGVVSAGDDSGRVELLCVIPPAAPPGDSRAGEMVEAILDGWADACGAVGSVGWARDRAREAVEAGWARPR